MKKIGVLMVLLLIIPMAFADVGSTLNSVWYRILGLGNLSFLGLSDGALIVGFTRLMIWLLMFTIFFAVITGMGGGGKGAAPMSYFNRGQAGLIAGIIATIAAVFLPAATLLAVGAGWATLIAFVLIGGPVLGIAFLMWRVPFNGQPDTKWTVLLKMVLCLLLLWILTAMKFHLGKLGGVL